MAVWTCPKCDRSFGRTGQGHLCEPTAPLEEYLGNWSDDDRRIAELVIDAVESCGPVDIEAAGVGLLFKTTRTIIELRPKHRRLQLSVVLARRAEGPRVRRVVAVGRTFAVFTDLRSPDDVDDWVHELIFEGYDTTPLDQ